jgi:phosphonate degradation associated HDIG domain protein
MPQEEPPMDAVAEILRLYAERGAAAYFGEEVSMTEHALQAAHFAEAGGAPPGLVVASLLHDVGHLLDAIPDNLADWRVDARHEEIGSRWLAARLTPAVTEPVRLHVPAKRYLCATDPDYVARLSRASVVTLTLQGGPMTRSEAADFERNPFFRDAVQVRQWDDCGKIAGLRTRSLGDYGALIQGFTHR